MFVQSDDRAAVPQSEIMVAKARFLGSVNCFQRMLRLVPASFSDLEA